MVDGTDELQNALAIDPKTLKPSTFGTKILTSHVHDALRDYLGLASASTTAVFPFNNTEKFNFLDKGRLPFMGVSGTKTHRPAPKKAPET
jgi:hypothetical protein